MTRLSDDDVSYDAVLLATAHSFFFFRERWGCAIATEKYSPQAHKMCLFRVLLLSPNTCVKFFPFFFIIIFISVNNYYCFYYDLRVNFD